MRAISLAMLAIAVFVSSAIAAEQKNRPTTIILWVDSDHHLMEMVWIKTAGVAAAVNKRAGDLNPILIPHDSPLFALARKSLVGGAGSVEAAEEAGLVEQALTVPANVIASRWPYR